MSWQPGRVELLDRPRCRGRGLGQQPQVDHRVGVLRVVLPQRDARRRRTPAPTGRSRACPPAAARPAPRSTRGVCTSGAASSRAPATSRGPRRRPRASSASSYAPRSASTRARLFVAIDRRARRPSASAASSVRYRCSASASRPAFCSTTARESRIRTRNRARSAGSMAVARLDRRERGVQVARGRAHVAQLLQDRRAAGEHGGRDVPARGAGGVTRTASSSSGRADESSHRARNVAASTRRLSPSSSGSFRRTCHRPRRPAPGGSTDRGSTSTASIRELRCIRRSARPSGRARGSSFGGGGSDPGPDGHIFRSLGDARSSM